MRITIIAFGTRGDVQPALTLGKALKARGHAVKILASSIFKNWLQTHGLEALPSAINIHELMESENGLDWVERGHSPAVQNRVLKNLVNRVGAQLATEALAACQGAQAVISSFTSDVCAATIAEKLCIPQISIRFQPSLKATHSGAATMNAPLPNRSSFLNYLFGKVILESAYWRWYGEADKRFRAELGLPTQNKKRLNAALKKILVLHAFSPTVAPKPPDWPEQYETPGYWFLNEGHHWQPPAQIAEFLASGAPPVFIGFGSMTGRTPEKLTNMIFTAIRESGQRAILFSGWAGLGKTQDSDKVLVIKEAPFDWLFPRVGMIVHHGGSGTTGEALRSGVPQILVPCFGDQLFWGKRIAALGVGPKALPRHQLTAEKLAQAIRLVKDKASFRERAKFIGDKISAENGLEKAIASIEQALKSPSHHA